MIKYSYVHTTHAVGLVVFITLSAACELCFEVCDCHTYSDYRTSKINL